MLPRQMDAFDHSPDRMAAAWRAAAESSREQFPDDHERYAYYAREAERLEKINEQ